MWSKSAIGDGRAVEALSSFGGTGVEEIQLSLNDNLQRLIES